MRKLDRHDGIIGIVSLIALGIVVAAAVAMWSEPNLLETRSEGGGGRMRHRIAPGIVTTYTRTRALGQVAIYWSGNAVDHIDTPPQVHFIPTAIRNTMPTGSGIKMHIGD